jgi:hypothetical protein
MASPRKSPRKENYWAAKIFCMMKRINHNNEKRKRERERLIIY